MPSTSESLAELLEPRVNLYMPHTPTVRQQAALLLDELREVLYGGAAGGGKSDWLMMAALQYVDVPNYSALLVRRTYAQLTKSDGLIERSKEWLSGTDAVWSEGKSVWRFPSGARLEFGHLQHENDKYNYQGAAYQFIGFDELTQFAEPMYRYLFSRLRKLEGASVPLRMRASSNPGGAGHDWVNQRFRIEASPGRAFVPAKLTDNPHLDQDQYRESLSELHPYERAQLLEGDWDAKRPGSRFKREWFPVVEEAPPGLSFVRYWDLAATEPKPGRDPDYTAGALVGKSADGTYYVADMRRFRAEPGGVQTALAHQAEVDGRAVPIWIEQEPGSSGKIVIASFIKSLAGYAVRGDRVTGSKIVRSDPFASQSHAGNVKLVRGPWVTAFLDELESPSDEGHDDQLDAAAGAFSKLHTSGIGWGDLYPDAAEEAEAA